MKKIMIITILASLYLGIASAAETTTECPMMREMNRRTNPKAAMVSKEVKKPTTQSSKGSGI